MSVFHDCLTGIETLIEGLSLTGFADANIIVQKLPWVRGIDIPCVIISPIDDPVRRVNNQQNEIGYGCHVVIVTAGNQSQTAGFDDFSDWREQIEEELRSDKLSAVSSIINITIEPSGLILSDAFRKQYDASAFVARCFSRESG